MEALIILIFVYGICLSVYFAKVRHDRNCSDWADAAFQFALQYMPAKAFFQMGSIFGKLGGRHNINISAIKEGGNKNSKTYTQYILNFAETVPCDFVIKKENFFTIAAKVLKFRDIETGGDEFDRLANINSQGSPELVKNFLNRQRRDAISNLLKICQEVKITNKSVIIKNLGIDNKHKLVECLTMLESLAKVFASNEPNEGAILSQSVTSVSSIKDKATDIKGKFKGKDIRFKVGKTDYNASNIVSIVPPDIPVKQQQTKKTKPPILNETENVEITGKESVVSATETKSEIPLQDFINNFFPKDSLLFDSSIDLEKFCQGKHVRWECILKNVRKTAFDLDFKDFKGTRAEGVLTSLNGQFGKKDEIIAVLALPDSCFEKLNSKIGQIISFAGKPIKVDTFLRKIFIEADII